MRSILRLFVLLCLCTPVLAQDYVDIATAGVVYSPNNAQENSTSRIDITETFLNVRFPLVFKNKDVLLTGINTNTISFHQHYEPVYPDKLYGTTLLLGYTHNWSSRFQTMLMALPRISSDFNDVTGRDLQLGGILLFTIKKNERFKYKLGAYYNKEFYGPLVIPIFGLDWKASDKLRVFGNFPINLSVERKLSERFSTGFFFQAINSSYRLGQQYGHRYLHKVSQDVSLYLDSYLTRNLVLTLKAGYTPGRSFGFYDEDDRHRFRSMLVSVGDRKDAYNNPIKDGLLLEARLSFRVFTNKPEVAEDAKPK